MEPPRSTQSGIPGRFRNRIPGGHVETGNGDHRQAFVTDEMQRLSGCLVEFSRRNPLPLQHRAHVLESGHEITH